MVFQTDPRIQFPNHKERGPKVHGFTLNDIADLTGKKLTSLRSGRRIRGLEDAVYDVASSWARSAREATDADLLGSGFGDWELPHWKNRWPAFRAWVCPRCPELVLARGACRRHGGSRAPVKFGPLGHFEVEDGQGWIPLHRIIMGCPKGLDVHHVDLNRWNNRRENLVAITQEEHRAIHFPRKERS